MKDLPGFETNYEVVCRFYRKGGSLSFVDKERYIFRVNAEIDARAWAEDVNYLLPTNISVRGPGGRFVKWRN